MTFWETVDWREYERLCGVVTPRAKELATATWETQVVDLSRAEDALWRAVRKSYKALIHKHQDNVRHIGTASAAVAFALRASALHLAKAGRATRPFESWQLMGAWARDGKADWWVWIDPETESITGYAYVVTFDDWACYHSSVTTTKDTAHALLWTALLALKKRGIRWFELGWLARPDDTDKDRAISFFKRGFGGHAYPANIVAVGFESCVSSR